MFSLQSNIKRSGIDANTQLTRILNRYHNLTDPSGGRSLGVITLRLSSLCNIPLTTSPTWTQVFSILGGKQALSQDQLGDVLSQKVFQDSCWTQLGTYLSGHCSHPPQQWRNLFRNSQQLLLHRLILTKSWYQALIKIKNLILNFSLFLGFTTFKAQVRLHFGTISHHSCLRTWSEPLAFGLFDW